MAAPLILAFDTSGPWIAAALAQGDRVLSAIMLEMDRGQAERLVPALGEMVAGHGWAALDAVACGTGPGNSTGVRVAVAAARAFALALGIPAVGVSRLEAAALGAALPCLVALDARRGEAAAQRFGAGARGPWLAAAREALPVRGCASIIGDAPSLSGALPLPPPVELASRMARIAAGRLGGEVPRPVPLYLRPAEAAPPRESPPVILP